MDVLKNAFLAAAIHVYSLYLLIITELADFKWWQSQFNSDSQHQPHHWYLILMFDAYSKSVILLSVFFIQVFVFVTFFLLPEPGKHKTIIIINKKIIMHDQLSKFGELGSPTSRQFSMN